MSRLLGFGCSVVAVVLFACPSTPASTATDGGARDAAVEEEPQTPVTACQMTTCAEGTATLCESGLSLACERFEGTCQTYTAEGGAGDFEWCDCGAVANGQGKCLSADTAVVCQGNYGRLATCPPGSFCQTSAAPPGVECACDDQGDGICPDAACVDDPDCMACTPNCGTRVCGDNGCGGSCGTCDPLREVCTSGACQCLPNCVGKTCGPDGCGGTCGACPVGSVCDGDTCKATEPSTCIGEPCTGGASHGQCCTAAMSCVFGRCRNSCGVTGEGCHYSDDCCSNYACVNGACEPKGCLECTPDDIDVGVKLTFAGATWSWDKQHQFRNVSYRFNYSLENTGLKPVHQCIQVRLYADSANAPSATAKPDVKDQYCQYLPPGRVVTRHLGIIPYNINNDFTKTGKAWVFMDLADKQAANNTHSLSWRVTGPY